MCAYVSATCIIGTQPRCIHGATTVHPRCRVQGVGCRVQGAVFWHPATQGSELRVHGAAGSGIVRTNGGEQRGETAFGEGVDTLEIGTSRDERLGRTCLTLVCTLMQWRVAEIVRCVQLVSAFTVIRQRDQRGRPTVPVIPCDVISGDDMRCSHMLCHARPCSLMSFHIMPFHVTSRSFATEPARPVWPSLAARWISTELAHTCMHAYVHVRISRPGGSA